MPIGEMAAPDQMAMGKKKKKVKKVKKKQVVVKQEDEESSEDDQTENDTDADDVTRLAAVKEDYEKRMKLLAEADKRIKDEEETINEIKKKQ